MRQLPFGERAFAATNFVEKPPLADGAANISPPATTSGTPACSRSRRARHPGRVRALCAGRRGRGAHRVAAAVGANDAMPCSRSTPQLFASGARHVDRLRGHGEGGGRRAGGRGTRRVRLERRRLVAGGLRAVRRRRRRQSRPAANVWPSHTRGTFVHAEDRVVATIGVENLVDRRHARRGAGRASRSPAARKGSGRRAQGARPRLVQAAQDRRAAVGHLHGARGGPRLQDQAHRGQARRLRCHCNCITAAASTGSSCAARRASPAASACSICRRASRRSFRSGRSTASRTAAPTPLAIIEVAVRRLHRRGRHRPLRRQVRAHEPVSPRPVRRDRAAARGARSGP